MLLNATPFISAGSQFSIEYCSSMFSWKQIIAKIKLILTNFGLIMWAYRSESLMHSFVLCGSYGHELYVIRFRYPNKKERVYVKLDDGGPIMQQSFRERRTAKPVCQNKRKNWNYFSAAKLPSSGEYMHLLQKCNTLIAPPAKRMLHVSGPLVLRLYCLPKYRMIVWTIISAINPPSAIFYWRG